MINETELVVIGGGAAGMMCAYTAASRGVAAVLLEPNRQLGRKVRITGKGRCNLTNNCDVKEFMRNIPGDGRFLYSALSRFAPADTIAFFESHGLPVKTERGNRVFPVSDNANDVAGTMTHLCERAGVQIVHTSAKAILTRDGAVCGVKTDEGTIACRAADYGASIVAHHYRPHDASQPWGADDLDAVLGAQDHRQAGADQALVVGDHHPDAHRPSTAKGNRAATRKPPTGPGPTSRSPPNTWTRSRMPIRP